jgi:poly-gamma-glutamate capsule biosynthesis protein CapA/YwtB (metallophosphatase superfamily)
MARLSLPTKTRESKVFAFRTSRNAFWLYAFVSLAFIVALADAPCFAAEDEAAVPGPVTIVFGGDVMLDGGPGHAVRYGKDPFADFIPILSSADIAVCNLECTVAEGGEQEKKPFIFLARPSALSVIKRHFTAVSIANNHALDYGPKAFVEELANLDKAGIGHFGGGHNKQEARRPLVLERKGRRVALLGYNNMIPRSFAAGPRSPGVAWIVEAEVIDDIRRARTVEHADIVIPFLHWGSEMASGPSAEQKALARRLIDAGADAVIGGHTHVAQSVDVYHGHPIIYALGNFVFDYFAGDPPVWVGWIVRLTFSKPGNVEVETFVHENDPAGIPHPVPAAPASAPPCVDSKDKGAAKRP